MKVSVRMDNRYDQDFIKVKNFQWVPRLILQLETPVRDG